MKRTARQLAGLVLALCMLLAVSAAPRATASPQPSAQSSNYTYLLEHGFPRDFLDHRTSRELADLAGLCYHGQVAYGATSVSSGCNRTWTPLGVITSLDMTLEISTVDKIATDPNGHTYIVQHLVYISYEWANAMTPLVRKEDSFQVSWEPEVWGYMPDSFTHTDYLNGTALDTMTQPDVDWSGLKYQTNFKAVSQVPGVLSGHTSFALLPSRNKLYPARTPGSRRYTNIIVNFAHDKNPVPPIIGRSSLVGCLFNFDSLVDRAGFAVNDSYQLEP